MFSNLFGKKESGNDDYLFTDRAYMTVNAKMKACADLANADADIIFIAWFEETASLFRKFFNECNINVNRITVAAQLHNRQWLSHKPVFVEHYPMISTEEELVKGWGLKDIPVYSALDEPLFKHFGSEKIIPVMKMMGMKENEVIEHQLVTKSIIKGQQKIQEQVVIEKKGNSQAAWMKNNLG